MSGIEITLVIVGVVLLVGSFFVQEKLSKKDVDQIAQLSENELKIIVEKQLKSANDKIEESIDEKIGDAMEKTEREMEKLTNEKIMAISEYSDTVLESINKSHNEIMFLYSMLNDKQGEFTSLANQLQGFSERMTNTENEILQKLAEAAMELEENMEKNEPIDEKQVLMESTGSSSNEVNRNDAILQLKKDGKTDVEIAKELGLGLGEVKLVIGLFKGEIDHEI